MSDCRFIAQMIEISSDGVALVEWTSAAQAADDRTPMDIGAEVYSSADGDYSYQNRYLAEIEDRLAGMILSFPTQARDAANAVSPPPFDGSDVLAPYKYLEAPSTWYVCGVGVVPQYRGLGIGTTLLEIARKRARDHGYARLSLVVFEENASALRLYQRLGYKIVDRAPVVPDPLIRFGGDSLLMEASAS